MKNKVSIETERYDSIVGGIKAAATDCILKDNDFLAYEDTKGTAIAEFLSHRADRVCELTKKLEIPTIVSMNPIMVDGTGMCGACRLIVGDEVKFACVDGPEFDGHKVDFDLAMKRQAQYKTEEGRKMLELQEGDTHHGGCGNCGGDK
jgi:hypothetical protein